MRKYLRLPLEVHFIVNIRRIDRHMAKPGADGVDVDTGTQQVSGGCVAGIEGGADLRTIQILMGHERLEDTTVYLQLTRRHLHAAFNPLEQIALPAVEEGRKR